MKLKAQFQIDAIPAIERSTSVDKFILNQKDCDQPNKIKKLTKCRSE